MSFDEIITALNAERRGLFTMTEAYQSATTEENKELATQGILNALDGLARVGAQLRAAVTSTQPQE